MEHLIDILQLTPQEIDDMVATANDIIDHPDAYAHKCDGKILATLFFEPHLVRVLFVYICRKMRYTINNSVGGGPMERRTIEENKEKKRDYSVLVGLRSPVLGADSADEESCPTGAWRWSIS